MSFRGARVHATIRIVALAAIAVATIGLVDRSPLHIQLDATKTRAYALSEQTIRLLGELEGDWRITVVAAEASSDAPTRRQVDEVLRRFSEINPRIRTRRLDPTDPRTLGEWEALLDDLQRDAGSRLVELREILDAGSADFDALVEFARIQSGALAALPPTGSEELDRGIAALRDGLAQLVARAAEFRESIRTLRETTATRPLSDDESTRAALLANHALWSDQLAAGDSLLRRASRLPGAPEALTRPTRALAGEFERLAEQLRRSQDRLSRAPSLELTRIGRALAEGEAAIVTGPTGSAAIPAWQIFPRLTRGGPGAASAVRFDRRFRGEQVITATIRSLLTRPPLVVLVHAEDHSLLKPADDRNDFAAAADALQAARFELREWLPTDASPPSAGPNQVAVWIVVPPLARRGLDMSPGERTLLERARRLIEEGQPVLLTVARSLRPLFRQEDPWARLAAASGITVETGVVVLALDRLERGRGATRSWHRVEHGDAAHPIARALTGQSSVFTHPTPLILEPGDGAAFALVTIEPSPEVWLENDWRGEGRERPAPPPGRALQEPACVVAAAERAIGERGARQRIIVVGSGGWLLTSVLDAAESLGGDRVVLSNPGNRELLLSSTNWLAGLDEQIAPGPTGRETARLGGIDSSVRTLWMIIALVMLPATPLLFGVVIIWSRRRG